MKKLCAQLLLLVLIFGWIQAVLAVPGWRAESKLLPADGTEYKRFGNAVSLSGDRLVVGADGDDSSTGAVYVFEFDGANWIQTAKLLPWDAAAYEGFGDAVSLDGNRLVVGASIGPYSSFEGAAYVFDYDGANWLGTAKLRAPFSERYDNPYFGFAVSLSGDRVVVGAIQALTSGAAYVFDFNGTNWVQVAKLLPPERVEIDWFGSSVDLNRDWVVVGAPEIEPFGVPGTGAAYVFHDDGSMVQRTELRAADGEEKDYFGFDLSLSGNRVVIGAYGDDELRGSAYVFDYNGTTWVKSAKLLASDGAAGDSFGTSVSLDGDRVVVSTLTYDDLGRDKGAVYVFDYDGNNWVQSAKLLAADGEREDRFGHAVSSSDDWLIVGAPYDDDDGQNSGSTHLFQLIDVIDPLPEVKVNGVEGPLKLSRTQELTLSYRLLAGETSGDVDWWLFAETPDGTYSYSYASQRWTPSLTLAHQGPIRDVQIQAFKGLANNLPLGTYLIFGGVDTTPNGVLDGPVFLGGIKLDITSP